MNDTLNITPLKNALKRLQQSLSYPEDQPLVLDASIQRFEFCIELTWKTLKKALVQEGITANTPRECIQQAFAAYWIDDEVQWLMMLKDRNLTSHTYKEALAQEIFQRLPHHLVAMQALLQHLEARL